MNCTDCQGPAPTLEKPHMPCYVRPDIGRQNPADGGAASNEQKWTTSMRDPLCKPCWEKAIDNHKREYSNAPNGS